MIDRGRIGPDMNSSLFLADRHALWKYALRLRLIRLKAFAPNRTPAGWPTPPNEHRS